MLTPQNLVLILQKTGLSFLTQPVTERTEIRNLEQTLATALLACTAEVAQSLRRRVRHGRRFRPCHVVPIRHQLVGLRGRISSAVLERMVKC